MIAPDLPYDFVSSEDLPRMSCQKLHDFELLWREGHGLAVNEDLASLCVDNEVAGGLRCGGSASTRGWCFRDGLDAAGL